LTQRRDPGAGMTLSNDFFAGYGKLREDGERRIRSDCSRAAAFQTRSSRWTAVDGIFQLSPPGQ
jgi:hypothetical protein